MRFVIVFLATFVMAFADKIEKKLQKLENNTEMSHKLVKRHCSCESSSSCSCAPIFITFQISCNCPQICKCAPTAPPKYPPVTYTLPPTLPTLPPVTYTLPPITPTPFRPSYCCILFICGSCGYYGGTYGGVQPSTQYKPPSGQYPSSYFPQLPSTYQLPVTNQYQISEFPPSAYLPSSPYQASSYAYPTSTSACSNGFTICFSGSFCCRK
uniref:Uncharacterized protein n=1 Tax=Onchocerca volvulus TaxID=6282 RepID=A0A8R1XMW9_ONCVO